MRSVRIEFDLVENARDSLAHAVGVLTQPDSSTSAALKQAILGASHCAELLLKERLRRVHPAFVWDNVDKYPSLDTRTVTMARAVTRLASVAGIQISTADQSTLGACRVMRNAIQHHEFKTTEKEAKAILGKALSFVFAFSQTELGLDLESEFQADDTWDVLLTDLYEFAQAHGERISHQLARSDSCIGPCPHCGQETVDIGLEVCKLCGHLWDPEE